MVSIMIDPSFSNSIWCSSMLAGLVSQLKVKRIPFRQIEDFSQLPENCRYIFLVGSDDTWVRSVLKVCNSLGVYPIFLGNEANHFSEFEYSTVCSDVIGSMINIVSALRAMNRHRIALYGVNPQSIADRGRQEAYLATVKEGQFNIFYNHGNLERCYQDFIRSSAHITAEYDAVICANSFAAISLITRLMRDDPARLKRLMILGYQDVWLSELYDDYYSTVQLNFEEYGKAAVMILDNLRKNGNISHMIIAIKWNCGILDIQRQDNKKPVLNPLTIQLPRPKDAFYEDPEILEMLLLEKVLYESEDLDKRILRHLLAGESYEQIAESCFLTVSTVKYRVKKMVGLCRLKNRTELLTLLQKYIPKGKRF